MDQRRLRRRKMVGRDLVGNEAAVPACSSVHPPSGLSRRRLWVGMVLKQLASTKCSCSEINDAHSQRMEVKKEKLSQEDLYRNKSRSFVFYAVYSTGIRKEHKEGFFSGASYALVMFLVPRG